MKDCPNCSTKMYVQQTVETPEVIYRCRKCKSCGWLVTSEERVSEDQTLLYKLQHAKRKAKNET